MPSWRWKTYAVVGAGVAVVGYLARRLSALASELALQRERKRVTQSVLRMTDAERSRLAADLHDGPVQQLTALLYGLEVARHHIRHGDAAAAESLLLSLEDKAAAEIHGLRRLMTHLRPPVLDELGLASAIQNQGRSFEASSGVPTQVDADAGVELPPDLETVLYRVTQESLTNVGKHARASRVRISLATSNGRVRLQIRDDGVGFDPTGASGLPNQDHFGLVSMRERVEMVGGRLVVDSTPGQGTTVAVEMGPRAS
jgi:signal transduction histidine kinase